MFEGQPPGGDGGAMGTMRTEAEVRAMIAEFEEVELRLLDGLGRQSISVAYERLKWLERMKLERAALEWVLGKRSRMP